VSRETTPLIQHMADLYNQATPKERKALDLKLMRLKASAIATPAAVFHLFPALGTKTLKLKETP
jgi:hypothetical protein